MRIALNAKRTSSSRRKPKKMAKKSREYEDYEAHDAMHTLMRAEEIRKDGSLMKRVAKKARQYAAKSAEVAQRASALAKSGHISEKQMSKLKGKVEKGQGGNPKALAKTGKIASGKEGDGGPPSRTMVGSTYH
jgi:hypothetical protein